MMHATLKGRCLRPGRGTFSLLNQIVVVPPQRLLSSSCAAGAIKSTRSAASAVAAATKIKAGLPRSVLAQSVTRLVHRRHARAVVLAREAPMCASMATGLTEALIKNVLARTCVEIKFRAPRCRRDVAS